MIDINSKCVRNLEVGDWVIVRILIGIAKFSEPMRFPIIGYSIHGYPVIGSNQFIMATRYGFWGTHQLHNPPEISGFIYCERLNQSTIEVLRITKGSAVFNAKQLNKPARLQGHRD
jgi:hypothetical protein